MSNASYLNSINPFRIYIAEPDHITLTVFLPVLQQFDMKSKEIGELLIRQIESILLIQESVLLTAEFLKTCMMGESTGEDFEKDFFVVDKNINVSYDSENEAFKFKKVLN